MQSSTLQLNGNCDLKICDFGLARGVREDVDYELTEYVVTRWYRAPEVMCSCQEYDHKIDVWSTGCIFAELHGRKPLFPGDDYIKQMNLIFGVLGTPEDKDMGFISNDKALDCEYCKLAHTKCDVMSYTTFARSQISQSLCNYIIADIKNLDKQKPIPFSELYPEASEDCLDLMKKMLTFDPQQRISVDEALKHPYLAELHNPKQEIK